MTKKINLYESKFNKSTQTRNYSEEFKRELVSLFEKGKFNVLQIEKLYGVNNINIYNWIYKYSTFNEKDIRVVEMKSSSTEKLKQLQQKVKELEQVAD